MGLDLKSLKPGDIVYDAPVLFDSDPDKSLEEWRFSEALIVIGDEDGDPAGYVLLNGGFYQHSEGTKYFHHFGDDDISPHRTIEEAMKHAIQAARDSANAELKICEEIERLLIAPSATPPAPSHSAARRKSPASES